MSSAFCWNDNYDVDGIIEEYDAKKAAEDVVNTEEESKAYVDSDALYEARNRQRQLSLRKILVQQMALDQNLRKLWTAMKHFILNIASL